MTSTNSKGITGRMRRLSVGAPQNKTSSRSPNKRDPRVARKRLSIADGGTGSNSTLLDGIRKKYEKHCLEDNDNDSDSNKKEIKEKNPNNFKLDNRFREMPDYNHVELISNKEDNKNTTYSSFALKSDVGMVPFNPNKVNQDRGLVVNNIQGQINCSFFGVFDGHGMHGDDVSQYLIHKIPKIISKQKNFYKNISDTLTDLFNTSTKSLKKSKVNCTFSGSTAIAVYMDEKNYYGANAGDSRAVLGRIVNGKIKAIPLSFDHKPDDPKEQSRIEKKNGRVEPCKGPSGEFIGPARVWLQRQDMPGLAMSRSFGDDIATSVGVHSIPEIVTESRDKKNDKFIVLGSDGVWEFMSNQEVCDLINKYKTPMEACRALVNESSRRWRAEEEVIDDTTALIAYL